MTFWRWVGIVGWPVMVFVALMSLPAPGLCQSKEIHGENSSFVGNGVAMAWGVLRGARDEDTQAILRIAPAGGSYVAISVDGVDPFSQRRQELLERHAVHLGTQRPMIQASRRTRYRRPSRYTTRTSTSPSAGAVAPHPARSRESKMKR